MFVLEPALLLDGSLSNIIISFITALIGVVSLGAGVIGWLVTKANLVDRLLLTIAGLLLIYPHVIASAFGVGLFIFVFVIQKRRSHGSSRYIRKKR